MAREQKIFQATYGRDAGNQFLITEMPAMRAEKWAARAILALGHAGVELPDDIVGAGWAVLSQVAFQSLARLDFNEAEPLLDEMLTCVEIIPNPAQPMVKRPLMEQDVQEVRTLVQLRGAIFELHTGFSVPAVEPTSTSAPAGSQSNS